MRSIVMFGAVGCAGSTEPVIDTGEDLPALLACADAGFAGPLDGEVGPVLRADGVPVYVSDAPDFRSLRLDPLGVTEITLLYDGGNSVPALYLDDSGEEFGSCEQRVTVWPLRASAMAYRPGPPPRSSIRAATGPTASMISSARRCSRRPDAVSSRDHSSKSW